jgi:predicted histone-like DNA-binding protein
LRSGKYNKKDKVMSRKTNTKKSGTIAYQLRRQNDLTGTATEKNPHVAVTIVNSKLTTTKELAEYINFACSVTDADVAAVLQALGKCVCDELLDGNRVELEHLGTFSLSLTCGNKRLEDRVTKKDIRVKSILSPPCAEMKAAMRTAEIVSGGPNPNKQLSDTVIERRLEKYFEEHEYMQRRDFESVCECSRYTATKKLKELVKAGKLRAMGAKNVRFYIKNRS